MCFIRLLTRNSALLGRAAFVYMYVSIQNEKLS